MKCVSKKRVQNHTARLKGRIERAQCESGVCHGGGLVADSKNELAEAQSVENK